MSGDGATPSTCGTEVSDVALAPSRPVTRLCGPGPSQPHRGPRPGSAGRSSTPRRAGRSPAASRSGARTGRGTSPSPDRREGSAVPYRKTAIGNPAVVEMHTTLSAHPFVVRLPPGRYTLTVERGKEYLPERREVTVGDEPVDLTVRLRRWIDMAGAGLVLGRHARPPHARRAAQRDARRGPERRLPADRLGPRGVRPAGRAARGVVPRPRRRPDPGRRHARDLPAEHRVRDLHGRQASGTPSGRSSCSTTRRRSTWACRRSARWPAGPTTRGR